MSFNIRYGTADDGENRWANRRELVFQVIREETPDLLGIQEALRFQLDEIHAAVPGYGEVGVGREDGETDGEYAAIFYRGNRFELVEQGTFWFSDTPDVPGSVSWGNRVTRVCTWARLVDRATGRGLYLFNVHFDHESQPSRERSAEMLASRIASRRFPDEPVIVTGDFNAGEDNPAIRYLTGNARGDTGTASTNSPPPGLVDTFRSLHPGADNVGTFNGFRGTTDGPRIDGILVSAVWDVLGAQILRTNAVGRYPSDHFPVTAKLSVR